MRSSGEAQSLSGEERAARYRRKRRDIVQWGGARSCSTCSSNSQAALR